MTATTPSSADSIVAAIAAAEEAFNIWLQADRAVTSKPDPAERRQLDHLGDVHSAAEQKVIDARPSSTIEFAAQLEFFAEYIDQSTIGAMPDLCDALIDGAAFLRRAVAAQLL